MANVTLELDEAELAQARIRAAEQGFAAVEPYLQSLVLEALHDDDEEAEDAEACYRATEDIQVTSLEQLEAMIIEGMESPAIEMSKADIVRWHQEYVDKISATGGK